MASTTSALRRWSVKIHRWLGVAAALFFFIEAVTGVFLAFHFEMEDAAMTMAHRPTDPAAIEKRLESFANAGGDAKVYWVWTTAGLPNRYQILFAGTDGVTRKAYIDGGGEVLRDSAAGDHTFLSLMRAIHIDLLAGRTGYLILAIAGILLVTNIVAGVAAAWPRKGGWRAALLPAGGGSGAANLYAWHRAIGLWAAIPAAVIAGTGSLILMEGPVRKLVNAPEIELPANPPSGPAVGFAAASRAAVEAIPGSRFVGTTLPTDEDASYHAWVRAPGELYRGGYGGSLVIVDANDASIRGAWPATDAKAGYAFVGSFYPLHTGESAGLIGRVLIMAIGLWLAVVTVLGVWLWAKRRPGRKSTERAKVLAAFKA